MAAREFLSFLGFFRGGGYLVVGKAGTIVRVYRRAGSTVGQVLPGGVIRGRDPIPGGDRKEGEPASFGRAW
jgi:hypothetical protein